MPLGNGHYKFQYCDVEYAKPICFSGLDVRLEGRRVWVTNNTDHLSGGKGLVESGTLHWHEATHQWIIVSAPGEVAATEVGGCSGGPGILDLEKRIYYAC